MRWMRGSPAHKAGLKAGDEILSVTGKNRTAKGYNEILNIISESKGIPLSFKIRRPKTEPAKGSRSGNHPSRKDSSILHLTITPIEEKGRVIIGFVHDYPSDLQKFGIIGASYAVYSAKL